MVYSSEASKWKAYQFNDPFAAGSFLFVIKSVKYIVVPIVMLDQPPI